MLKHGAYYWLLLAKSHLGKLREPENQSRTKTGRRDVCQKRMRN
jgi:hypothetical protein